jgi:hypothetical protein
VHVRLDKRLVHIDKPAVLGLAGGEVALEAPEAELVVDLVDNLDLLEALEECCPVVLAHWGWAVASTAGRAAAPAALAGEACVAL